MQRFRFLIAGWLLLLLLVPGVAWLLGERQPVLENRAKTEFPAFNRSSLPNAKIYPIIDAAILDRLPFRGPALELRGRISVQAFGDTTSPTVILGRDGWLFYSPDTRVCTGEGRPETDPADALEIVARSIVASGRRGGLLVAGSKSVAMREFLKPGDRVIAECAAKVERRVQARLRSAPGGLDIQGELDARRARGVATFLKTDTHWNPESRLLFLRAILDRARPGLAAKADLAFDPSVDIAGDLGRLLGVPVTDPVRYIHARVLPAPPAASIAFIGDSQMNSSLNQLTADGSTVVGNALPGSPVCSVDNMGAGACDTVIRSSRSLVMELVARNLKEATASCWRPVSIVNETSHGTPMRWQRSSDPAPASRLRLQTATEAVSVSADNDIATVPRLFRLPIQRFPAANGQAQQVALSQQVPPGQRPVPCLTPVQGVEGGALFLPVPAGQAVSQIALTLTGPPGTLMGTPEEIMLDGTKAPQR